MSKNRTEYAEGFRDGRKIINELFRIVEAGKRSWSWIQTIDGVPHEKFRFISEKNMRDKMREWDFHFEKVK